MQIAADAFNLAVECPSVSETSALGAAMIAAYYLCRREDMKLFLKGERCLTDGVTAPAPSSR